MTQPQTNLRWVTTGLWLGLVLSSLDQTVISLAMPTVSTRLGGLTLYGWVFAAYMLTSTVSIPIYGKLADLFGRKQVYLAGGLIFLVGSLLCGLAWNMAALVGFRAIQGLGAGCLMPVAFTLIADLYPIQERGRFQALFGAVLALASICGPAVGGLMVQYWNWRWIFYMNLVLGMPALLVVGLALHEQRQAVQRRIDWAGALTFSAGMVAILLALQWPEHGQASMDQATWTTPGVWGLLLLGGVLLGVFVWTEKRVAEPMIPLWLFRQRTVACSNMAGFFVSAAMFDVTTFVPLFVQGSFHVPPAWVSFMLTPLMLTAVVSMQIGGRLLRSVSYRALLVPCMAVLWWG